MLAFSNFILRRAGWVSLLGTLLAIAGGYYSVLLYKNLRTNFEELLPTSARSVVDLQEVSQRLQSLENLAILISSEDTAASKRFVIDLSSRLNQLPRSVVASVEYQIQKELRFFKERQALYMEYEDLVRVRDYIDDRIEYEKELHNPLNIFSETEIPEPHLDFLALRHKYQGRGGSYERFPDGFYATPDEKKRVILIYLPAGTSGIDSAHRLKVAVEKVVAEVNPSSYSKEMVLQYTGGVQDQIEEHEALIEDLELSTIIVTVVVALAMFLYYRSFRATLALNLSLFAGTLWAFGASYFAVGYLNANSAFLGSIVIGNGINFGIIFLARYLEERRNGMSHEDSTRAAITGTATSTGTAAMAAGLSYGSLILTDFRGFQQFGVIGLIGMLLCWGSAFIILPAYLTLLDRISPLVRPGSKPPKSIISGSLATIVGRFPKAIWYASLAFTVISIALSSRFNSDVMETNLANLRNRDSIEHGSGYLNRKLDEIFQRYLSPLAILPKTREDAAKIAARLRETQAREGKTSLIASVQTLEDFIPNRQPEKIAVLKEIRRILPPRLTERLSASDRRLVADFLTPEVMKPVYEADLPELILSKFTEKDGSRGKLVLVEPPLNNETWQGPKLIRFIRQLREVADSVSPGSPVAGTTPITTDMLIAISKDGPKATLFAFLAVVVLVVLLFRSFGTVALVLFSLSMGMVWLVGIVLGFELKINFLNFIALPITFGIGVDYGVNIFQRYREEGGANILSVIRNTGGAVLLASFTTVVGYCSLLIARNQGFVSFGLLAVAGEITCLFAALFSFPAFLILRHRTQTQKLLQPIEVTPRGERHSLASWQSPRSAEADPEI